MAIAVCLSNLFEGEDLGNNLRSSIRFLYKNKGYAAVNIFGFTVALGLSFFALLYVRFEQSYDTYHDKADRIYRLVTDIRTPSGISHESTPGPLAPVLQASFPEVQEATRVLLDYMIVEKEGGVLNKENLAYVEPSFFSVFTYPFLRGSPGTAMQAPFSVVLSESAALNYFGTIDCLGETLQLDGEHAATVTGIMEDMPYNSHFRVDILVSMSTLLKAWNPSLEQNWKRFIFYTYILLPGNDSATELGGKLEGFVESHFRQAEATYTLLLEPLREVYQEGLPRGSRTGSSKSGDKVSLYILSLIAGLVLIIASFNFINLTIAFSMGRGKELGVRKVLGASRVQLISRSVTEAVLLALLAFGLAVVFCVILLPWVNQLAGTVLSDAILGEWQEIVILFLLAIGVGVLSGVYPGLVLSNVKPLQNLRGLFVGSGRRGTIRKTLVVTQFSVSIVLIVSTAVMHLQLDFVQNQQLGFKKDGNLVIDFFFRSSERVQSMKEELASVPGIEGISMSSAVPGKANRKYLTQLTTATNQSQELLMDAYFVDDLFTDLYALDIVAGRGFSSEFTSDEEGGMLINESAARLLGYGDPAEAIGISFSQGRTDGRVVGVLKDFKYHSLRESIRPLAVRKSPKFHTFMTLNLSSRNVGAILDDVERIWESSAPDIPYSYFFLDESFNAQYLAEERIGYLVQWFSIIAIALSCLGLIGLSAFSANKRMKEMGIRKVLGASSFGVFGLLTQEFLLLTAVAFLFAAPVAWLAMQAWLSGFAYHIEMPLWVYVLAGVTVTLLTILTVSYQSLRVVMVNPVSILKGE